MTTKRTKAARRPGLRGRPTKANAEALEAMLLDVAAGCFRARGYGGTRVQDVIRDARVSPTTFYRRFAGKEALFRALIERGGHQANRVEFQRRASLEDSLLDVGGQLLGNINPAPFESFRLVAAEARRFPELAQIIEASAAQTRAQVERAFRAFWNDRPDAEIRSAAYYFVYMLFGIPLRHAMLFPYEPLDAVAIDSVLRTTVQVFLGGWRPGNVMQSGLGPMLQAITGGPDTD